MVKNRLEQAEQQTTKYNSELSTIMQGYKFEYGMEDIDQSDEAL
jgi:hypothetical protein